MSRRITGPQAPRSALVAVCTLATVTTGSATAAPRATVAAQVYAEQVAAAREAQAQHRLREALWRWRVAEAVAPDRTAAAAEVAAAEARLSAEAAALSREGDAAARAGHASEAHNDYLRALKLDDSQQTAGAFMRSALARSIGEDVRLRAGESPVRKETGPKRLRAKVSAGR